MRSSNIAVKYIRRTDFCTFERFMPNSHRHCRRDETVEFSWVGCEFDYYFFERVQFPNFFGGDSLRVVASSFHTADGITQFDRGGGAKK